MKKQVSTYIQQQLSATTFYSGNQQTMFVNLNNVVKNGPTPPIISLRGKIAKKFGALPFKIAAMVK